MSFRASATTPNNHHPQQQPPPSLPSPLSSNMSTPFRTSIRELSSTGGVGGGPTMSCCSPCSPRNHHSSLLTFSASATTTHSTTTTTHTPTNNNKMMMISASTTTHTPTTSITTTSSNNTNTSSSSNHCSSSTTNTTNTNTTTSRSRNSSRSSTTTKTSPNHLNPTTTTTTTTTVDTSSSSLLRANSSSSLPRRRMKPFHDLTNSCHTNHHHETMSQRSSRSSDHEEFDTLNDDIPSSLSCGTRESHHSDISEDDDVIHDTKVLTQNLTIHNDEKESFDSKNEFVRRMNSQVHIHAGKKMFTFTPSPSKEEEEEQISSSPPSPPIHHHHHQQEEHHHHRQRPNTIRCKTTDDIRTIYRANGSSPNLISHKKHSYSVRDKSRTLLWLNRDKHDMVVIHSPGSPNIGNGNHSINGNNHFDLHSSFILRAAVTPRGNTNGTLKMDHAATSVDLSSNGMNHPSEDSSTLTNVNNNNLHLLGMDDEEEDEEMKMERRKNIPTCFSDVTEELHYYIKNNLLDEFKRTLERERNENNGKFNVSTQYLDKDANNSSLLHKSASLNRFKFMGVLIDDYRAFIEKKDIGGSTPLFYAVANNCIRACFYLLNKGCSVNIRDNFENTPLSVALRKGHMDVAKTLILFGADVNFKTQKGQTCLHMCCEEGDLSKVEFLLERGASIMRMNREDQYCFFQAAPHPHIIEYLCRYLLSIEEESVFNNCPTPSPTSMVPSKVKNLEIEEQNKQDKQIFENMQDALSTTTSTNGRDSTTKPTFSKLIVKMSGAGNTIIHHCASFGYLTSLKILVNYMNYETIVECLNTKDKKNGDTPLHVAVRKGHQDIALLLARAREVDVDAQNDSGDTALHIAISQQNQEIVTILVAANCSVNIKNNQKLTAKQLAKKYNMSLKVEQDKTLKSLKTQQTLGFFQKMKMKFKKESNLTLEEKAAKRHTSAFIGSNTRLSTKDVRRISRGSSNMNKIVSQDEIEDMIKNQPYLKWTSKLEFDPEMNEYHKELFYQVNKLYYYWVADQHSIQIQICLSDLLEKTRKFFSKQDQYMQEHHYSALAAHKQDHDMFLNKIESTLNKLNTLDCSLDEDLFSQISTSLLNHVLKHDMGLSIFSKKKK